MKLVKFLSLLQNKHFYYIFMNKLDPASEDDGSHDGKQILLTKTILKIVYVHLYPICSSTK